MRVISVITAVHGARLDLLRQAGKSLAAQELPAGWSFEWIIQEDGVDNASSAIAAEFPFARYEHSGQRLGPGGTRNFALVRSSGELVHVLDSDDQLLPNCLATAVAAFDTYPEAHWVAGQADDLLPDESRVAFEPEISTGLVPTGVFGDFFSQHDRMPVHPAGTTIRTDTLRALGGWAALPIGEDTLLMVALTELFPGVLTERVTWLYRKHSDQVTAGLAESTGPLPHRTAAHQRLAALRRLRVARRLIG
jgi:glycosyltransferase involved in cell wall biosynthesis